MDREIEETGCGWTLESEEWSDPDPRFRSRYRIRSLRNLMGMGHCAPTVMKTLLDMSSRHEVWPVRLAAGFPGGIGNSGGECGGVTSPLIFLGLRLGAAKAPDGLPLVIEKGREHVRRFEKQNGTLLCREIRGEKERLLPCIQAIRRSPELYPMVLASDSGEALAGDARRAIRLAQSAFDARGFHCAHSVFRDLGPVLQATGDLLNATRGFAGGTAFLGLTCGALSAGVMAAGLKLAEIEWNHPRVLRMVGLMATHNQHAFDDRINKFNIIMNLGNRLALGFEKEFGGILCRGIAGCDFASPVAVERYLGSDGPAKCERVAAWTAARVRKFLAVAADGTPPGDLLREP